VPSSGPSTPGRVRRGRLRTADRDCRHGSTSRRWAGYRTHDAAVRQLGRDQSPGGQTGRASRTSCPVAKGIRLYPRVRDVGAAEESSRPQRPRAGLYGFSSTLRLTAARISGRLVSRRCSNSRTRTSAGGTRGGRRLDPDGRPASSLVREQGPKPAENLVQTGRQVFYVRCHGLERGGRCDGRKSATRSAIDTSISWPMAQTTGTHEARWRRHNFLVERRKSSALRRRGPEDHASGKRPDDEAN